MALDADFHRKVQALMSLRREVNDAGIPLISWSEARDALRDMGFPLRDDNEVPGVSLPFLAGVTVTQDDDGEDDDDDR